MTSIEFLKRLIADLDREDVSAIGLTGSHARGTASPYSDVDMHVFVTNLPERDEDHYTLRRVDEHLVSISVTSIKTKRAEITRPETLIWAVPGLRQMRVLLDKRGELAALKRDVDPFNWKLFQSAADAYASRELMGLAEEAHKIMGALLRNDLSAMAYGTLGLVLGIARVVSVQRGLFIESENRYFAQVLQLFESHADWTRCFCAASGLTVTIAGEPVSVSMRAFFALNLYLLTALELHAIINPEHQPVIRAAIDLIEAQQYFYRDAEIMPDAQRSLP